MDQTADKKPSSFSRDDSSIVTNSSSKVPSKLFVHLLKAYEELADGNGFYVLYVYGNGIVNNSHTFGC